MAIAMARHRSLTVPIEWLDGVPLRDAWYVFASDYAKSAYNGSPGRKVMIVLDMWADLADGKLLAYGDCVKPEEKTSDGPVPLPSHMFQEAPPFNIGDDNTVEISGWRYERVRIFRISSSQPLSDCDALSETSDHPAKRGGGRPNLYGLAEPILKTLGRFEKPVEIVGVR